MLQAFKKAAEFFGSIRLAIFLIISITVVSFFGVIIPQDLPHPQYLHRWGPALGQVLLTLGIDHLFSTVWFYLLLGLVSCNILVCSSTRLLKNARSSLNKTFLPTKGSFGKFKHSIAFPSKRESRAALDATVAYLKSHRYGVKVQHGDMGIQIAARKGLLKDVGSMVFHISIVLLLIGGLVGSRFGNAVVKQLGTGQTTTVPGRDFRVRCDWFRVTRNEDGSVKEYQSKLTLLGPKDSPLAEKVVQVNSPLSYQGVRFYQSSYGEDPAGLSDVSLQISGPGIPNGLMLDTVPYDSLCRIPKSDLSILVSHYLPDFIIDLDTHEASSRSDEPNNPAVNVMIFHGPDTLYDHWSFFKYPDQHEPAGKYAAVVYTYTPLYYTGIQIRRNPGEPIIWFGIVCMTLGILAVFYVSRKSLWVLIEPKASESTEISLSCAPNRAAGDAQSDFEKTVSSLKKLLQ